VSAEKSEGAIYGMEALALGGLTETGSASGTFEVCRRSLRMSAYRQTGLSANNSPLPFVTPERTFDERADFA
jgi:hypothetical protein